MLECTNDIGLSSFDTVVSNSCTICFVFTYVFSVCLLSAVFMDLFLRILTRARARARARVCVCVCVDVAV